MSLEKIKHNVEQLGIHLHYLIDSFHAGDTRKNTVDNIIAKTNALIDAQIKAEADRKTKAVQPEPTPIPEPKEDVKEAPKKTRGKRK